MFDLLLLPALTAVTLAIACGPLGCFVVWRRMAYFGDTLAHSALMGVALGLFFEIDPTFAVVISSLIIAALLVALERQKTIATDTLLGIFAHSALAVGLIAISLTDNQQLDLNTWLFGDLLSTTWEGYGKVAFGSLMALGAIIWAWKGLLAMTIHEELAAVEGVPVKRLKLLLMMITAVLVAIAMKVVGVLLVTALLIIPAATARSRSSSPKSMAIKASMVGILSACGGLALSWFADTPTGPSIVVSATALFVFSRLFSKAP